MHDTRNAVLLLAGTFAASTVTSYLTGTATARVIWNYKYAKALGHIKPPRRISLALLRLRLSRTIL